VRESEDARCSPHRSKHIHFALFAGSAISPFRCNRSRAFQSNPFQRVSHQGMSAKAGPARHRRSCRGRSASGQSITNKPSKQRPTPDGYGMREFQPRRATIAKPQTNSTCEIQGKKPRYQTVTGGISLPPQWVDLYIDQFGSCRNTITSPLDWIAHVDNG
jgi:hypothetical protein